MSIDPSVHTKTRTISTPSRLSQPSLILRSPYRTHFRRRSMPPHCHHRFLLDAISRCSFTGTGGHHASPFQHIKLPAAQNRRFCHQAVTMVTAAAAAAAAAVAAVSVTRAIFARKLFDATSLICLYKSLAVSSHSYSLTNNRLINNNFSF